MKSSHNKFDDSQDSLVNSIFIISFILSLSGLIDFLLSAIFIHNQPTLYAIDVIAEFLIGVFLILLSLFLYFNYKQKISKTRFNYKVLENLFSHQNTQFSENSSDSKIQETLSLIAHNYNLDRVFIIKQELNPELNEYFATRIFEWTKEHGDLSEDLRDKKIPYSSIIFQNWSYTFLKGESIYGTIQDFSKEEFLFLEARGVLSLLYTPIMLNNYFWGYIGIEDCQKQRLWSNEEKQIIQYAAESIGIALIREKINSELLQHKHQLQCLLDSSVNGILSLESIRQNQNQHIIDFKITMSNSVAGSIFNLPINSLIGQRLKDTLLPSSIIENILTDYVQVVELGTILTKEYNYTFNNSSCCIKIIGVKLMDGLVLTISDITQQKDFENKLNTTRQKYELALNGANLGIWDWHIQKGYTQVNSRYAEILGYNLEEIQSKIETISQNIHEDDKERVTKAIMDHLHGNIPNLDLEYRMLSKDGSWKWILNRGKIIEFDENGLPTRASGTHLDITERKITSEKFKLIFDQSPVSHILTDENGKILQYNIAFSKITHYSTSELIGQYIQDITPQKWHSLDQLKYSDLIHNNNYPPYQKEFFTKDGHTISVSVRGIQVSNTQGKKEILLITEDITELLAYEKKLKEAKDIAVKANESKSQFLANMSHEIRTPLNGIIGMTSLLGESPLSSQQIQFVKTIRNSSDSLLSIINDILDFTKIESNHIELEQRSINLRETIEQSLDLISFAASEKNIQIHYFIHPETPEYIISDSLRIQQILNNLLSNALKFTEKGSIQLNIQSQYQPQKNQEWLQIEVKDTGIGMTSEQQSRLFNSFMQGDSSMTRKYGGTGLGLAITKMLVEKMQGFLLLVSEYNKGTTFNIKLPLILPEKTSLNSSPLLFKPHPLLHKKSFLILSDDNLENHYLESYLKSWGIHPSIIHSLDTLHTIFSNQQFTYDFVIINIANLNIQDDSFQSIKNQLAHTPTIIYQTIQLKLFQSTSSHYLTFLLKPIKPAILFNTLLNFFENQSFSLTNPSSSKINTTIESPPDNNHNMNSLHVLLVEDNKINQVVMLKILEKLGITPDIAENGEAAVKAALNKHYDLIFMDLQMPVMDGITATKHILHQSSSNKLPWIIALTANACHDIQEECLKIGMNDFLTKPIKITDIQSALKKIPSKNFQNV